ncbi:hypothetical protein BGZ88_011633 [Linnemannia elongata]|nr:hypothetical protein BGZ88_011633 [Linnemannia elongata]
MSSSRQEYVYKEMESTLNLFDLRQGPSRNTRGDIRPEYRSSTPWHGSMLQDSLPKTQSADMREPTDCEIRSARLQSQSLQDNSSSRPSNKRIREDHYGPSLQPSSSFNGNPPSDHLALSAPVRIPPLRKSVNSSSTAPPSSSSSMNNNEPPPALLILDADLWAQFHEQHNEMIITKSGRCLFPCLRFKILGLDPDSYYSLRVDFEMLTPNRFRFSNGGWKPMEPLRQVDDIFSSGSHDSCDSTDHSTATTSGHLRESFIHPDRWQLGRHWMADPISFAKVKLTNKVESPSNVVKRSSKKGTNSAVSVNKDNGDPNAKMTGVNDINTNMFHMTSFHKYCPRIYLTQRAKDSHDIINSIVYRFDRTEFMAVTHYQNYKVNDLKKSHNPHAKGFRGTIGKVLPPVKFPVGQHYRGGLDKHSSLANPESRPKKRTRSSWRSDESESDDGMDGDYEPDNEEADMMESAVTDPVDAMTIGTRSGMHSTTVVASMTSVPRKNTGPTCRLDNDNNALVTISLRKDGQEEAKVSERTRQHYFDQDTPLNGDAAVGILGSHSRSPANETTWMDQQFLHLAQSISGDNPVRSARHFYGINQQQQHANHRHNQHQKQPQQLCLVISSGGGGNNKMGEQRSPPLQPLFFDRAPTVRIDREPTLLSDTTSNTLLITSPPPPHISSMPDGSVVDDDCDNAHLLQLNHSIPSISLAPPEDDLMSNQTSLQLPSAELECSDLVVAEASTALALNTASAPPSLSWYQQFLLDQNTANLVQHPAPAAASAASTVVADDVDGSGLPLTFQHIEAMDSAAAAANSSSTVGLAHSSTQNPHGASSVQLPTKAFGYDDGCSNGVVPTMSVFGSRTSTSSLAIADSSHSGLSSVTSVGRSRTDPKNMYGLYGYGPAGGSNDGSGGTYGSRRSHPNPLMTKTTILESKAFMSTSSVISILPITGSTATVVEDRQKASIDCLVHENLRLKAFIRERYGVEAESEANAVVAMEHHQ